MVNNQHGQTRGDIKIHVYLSNFVKFNIKFETLRKRLTRALGSAPAANNRLIIGMWFLHVAIWRAVRPKAFLELIFPPFFLSKTKAESTSTTNPLCTASHRSLEDPFVEDLRPAVWWFCLWLWRILIWSITSYKPLLNYYWLVNLNLLIRLLSSTNFNNWRD